MPADDDGLAGGAASDQSPVDATRRNSTASDVNSATAGNAQPTNTRRAPSQIPGTGAASSAAASARQLSNNPPDQSNAKPPRKPGMGRRTTSNARLHKGQEFSVDDAEEEIGELLAQQRQSSKMASGSLRRVPSTLRRRPSAQPPPSLPKVDSTDADDDEVQAEASGPPSMGDIQPGSSGEDTVQGEDSEEMVETADDDADLSDAESFTLKDRQEAINETHPFGIRIWKPALYKKNRSVQKTAAEDIHSTPGGFVSNWLLLFNFMWTILFGWWLAAIPAAAAIVCFLFGFADGAVAYGKTFSGLAWYLLYPFGKYVKLIQEEAYLEEDEGEGRSISEYEQWQSGDIEEGGLFFGPTSRSLVGRRRNSLDSADETQSLLGRPSRRSSGSDHAAGAKRRLFGRGKWNAGRVFFFIIFYGLLTPALFLVSAICWLFVFTIPMGRVTYLLFDHLRRHPLALSFHSDSADIRRPGEPASSILLCTYRAVGIKYWKYTIDGTNIFLINLLGVVAFVIFDYFILDEWLGLEIWLTNTFLLFALALFSIIPLAYFIGQAVASISAQSSMGVGATINAFFSTVVEVFLYCVALNQGKAQLVEGSIIGSIFAGVLFLPGISMCFGALKRKTQRFNVKSAGVTSTMLLFAVIGSFGPTLFYQIYGSHELNCHSCTKDSFDDNDRDCRRCYFSQTPAVHDRFYLEAVRPYTWFAAVLLFLSYAIGLIFTLRTHAAVIWNTEADEKKYEKMDMAASNLAASGNLDHQHRRPGTMSRGDTMGSYGTLSRSDIRNSDLYKRILGQSLKQIGLPPDFPADRTRSNAPTGGNTPHVVPPQESEDGMETRSQVNMPIHGMTEEENNQLVRQVAEMAATAAAVAARDAARMPRRASHVASMRNAERPTAAKVPVVPGNDDIADTHTAADGEHAAGGGHDAPNWSRTKSAVILLTATVAYAIIAEILVNTVDVVLENVDIDEKFLGITLFALVPNTTEFLNAISFAMNGNIALSMEIGSAYALQVCLLQVPALVLYSAIHGQYVDPGEIIHHTFTLIFPQWDMVTVILCVFLLSYMYGEGKSNYFKGSILILSYLVVIVGFYFTGYNDMDVMEVDRYNTLAIRPDSEMFSQSFKTRGGGHSGRAF
ncbi:uncharacterized protein K452DRAFT_244411 [Aplosporella prunicola CBS 121167]|uniref:Uncharacterized protein n=1 Tax=Aplosporella prunicola CBS 121167 TaxID=1176127 RepID=A0A6A6BND7_9PEZI|nr:uncharacterized protein K452DRAFT_244411 [Aplosporella prunicola CBS 121167]KAF2144933.1 hypothetical protein K452DRAFT_244411 [Aplosporella prunicola CBS 121167]